jgi:hypothetical protein
MYDPRSLYTIMHWLNGSGGVVATVWALIFIIERTTAQACPELEAEHERGLLGKIKRTLA